MRTILLLLTFLIFSGCETIAEFKSVASTTADVSFSGVDSIDYTDSTATLHWSAISGADAYQIMFIVSNTPKYITTVESNVTSYTVTGLTPNSSYTFRVRSVNSLGYPDSNTHDLTITTNLVPDAPTGITLIDPLSSSDFQDTITVRVEGVKSGDTIKLFTDSSCSSQTGNSVVATSSSVEITSSSFNTGTYNLYANATGAGGTSSCSSATLTYTKNECPNGYVLVPANSTVEAPNNFCVMQFEAKNDGNNNPVSTATGLPWVSITQEDAKAECKSLGEQYDLISNPEWMAIARNAENVDSNWTGGVVGDGILFRGHTDDNPSNALEVTDINDYYNGTGNSSSSSPEQRRVLELNNGNKIWDLAGNVYEWVDWTLDRDNLVILAQADRAYVSGDGGTVSEWREFSSVDTFTALAPSTSILPRDPTFNASNGMGSYYSRGDNSGGAALRGGDWDNGTDAGAFALSLSLSSTDSYTFIGFRCVFRVPSE